MKLIVVVILLVSSYADVHFNAGEKGGNPNLSEKNGEKQNEVAEDQTYTDSEQEGDPDIIGEVSDDDDDDEPVEVVDDADCDSTTDTEKKASVTEESMTTKQHSLQHQNHLSGDKVGKRSVSSEQNEPGHHDGAATDNQLRLRATRHSHRSIESEEDETTPDADDDPLERKRRNTEFKKGGHYRGEHHGSVKRSTSSNNDEHEHERVVRKRDTGQHENLPELTFGSDDEQQVNSVAVRVKRVSRAGSSHRPRVMNKNKSNSHAHQSKAVEKEVERFD